MAERNGREKGRVIIERMGKEGGSQTKVGRFLGMLHKVIGCV